MKISRQVGTTSQICEIMILNSGSTTGAGLTGLTNSTSGLICYYKRNTGSASVAVTLDAVSTLGTYEPSSNSHGAFLVVDGTNMPGLYEFQLPNNALASGADSVVFYLSGAANMAPCVLEIELTATSNQDGVHGGMNCLPNTACTTNASLLTSGTGTDQIANSAGKLLLQATQTGVTIPTVTTVTNQLTAAAIATGVWTDTTGSDFSTVNSPGHIIVSQLGQTFTTNGSAIFTVAALANAPTGGSAPTTAQIATAVWEDTLAGGDFGTAGSIGLLLKTAIPNATAGSSGGLFIAGTNAATSVTTAFTTTFTGNLTGSAGSVTSPVSVNLSQTLSAARALDSVADTSLTLNDGFHCAIGVYAGKWDISGTSWVCQTPYTGTTLRTFTLDSSTAPTQRS